MTIPSSGGQVVVDGTVYNAIELKRGIDSGVFTGSVTATADTYLFDNADAWPAADFLFIGETYSAPSAGSRIEIFRWCHKLLGDIPDGASVGGDIIYLNESPPSRTNMAGFICSASLAGRTKHVCLMQAITVPVNIDHSFAIRVTGNAKLKPGARLKFRYRSMASKS